MKKRQISTNKTVDASEETKHTDEQSAEITRSLKILVKLLIKAEEVYQARIAAGLPGEVEPEEWVGKDLRKKKK